MDYFLSFFVVDCDDSEVIVLRLLSHRAKDIVDIGTILEVDKYASHKPACLLVDIDAYIFNRAILAKNFSNIPVCEVSVYILHVQAVVLL